ncbi:hypothetical protein V6N13_107492 [Hibiscus sabdariffa]
MSNLPRSDSVQIRQVWEENLDHEINFIGQMVDSYPYIAMDTEFPGTVIPPTGDFKNVLDYEIMKENVNVLKVIQLGLTLFDDQGNLPAGDDGAHYYVWQFNFKFDRDEDRRNEGSIEFLSRRGTEFNMHKEKGVNAKKFGELFMASGAVSNVGVHWVTFQGGRDLGNLLKLLSGKDLPATKKEFFCLVKAFFPSLYDVKYLITLTNGIHGGLEKLAELLQVEGIGVSHQAASDSWLTCGTFLKLKEEHLLDPPIQKYVGKLFWLGAVDE